MIEASRIVKTFGQRRLLEDVCLEVHNGRAAALLGPTGVGKTTLLRIVAGLDQPDAGTVTINDQKASSELIGYVPQNARDALLPWLRVDSNLSLGELPPLSLPAENEMNRLIALLAARRPWHLSGGQCQLIAVARALRSTKAIILDEPFSALDYRWCGITVATVRERVAASNVPCLLTSHDLDVALAVADDLLLFDAPSRQVEKLPLPSHADRPEGWPLTAGYARLRQEILERIAVAVP